MTNIFQNLLRSPGDGFKIAMGAFDHTRPGVRPDVLCYISILSICSANEIHAAMYFISYYKEDQNLFMMWISLYCYMYFNLLQ